MSAPTKPCFVIEGGWSNASRAHPGMKWMENYNYRFDEKDMDPKYFTEDLTFIKADGSKFSGRDKALAAVKELYQFFTEYQHEAEFGYVEETDYGWQLLGQATMFGNLPGNPAPGEQKVKDKKGREWETGLPGAFRFQYRKSGDNIAIQMIQIHSD